MPVTVTNPCSGEIIAPKCDPCFGEVEHGRIRGVGYIQKSYLPTIQTKINALVEVLNANPINHNAVDTAKTELQTAWTEGLTNNVIYVIPETTGTFDGGSPVEGPGYGDRESRFIGYKFGLAYKDPSFEANTGFYNTISQSTGWHLVWRTETLTRISNNPVTIVPKSPVQEDMNSEVVWEVEVKWNGADQPIPYGEMIGFFVCPNQ